jgi:hypothetical protein
LVVQSKGPIFANPGTGHNWLNAEMKLKHI